MSDIKRGKFCHNCQKQTMHLSPGPNHLIHFLMTLLTFGAWLLIWMWACILPSKFRCAQCGSVYSGSKARKVRRQQAKADKARPTHNI